MGIIAKSFLAKPNQTDFDGVSVIEWANMKNGDTGEAIMLPRYSDRSVQVDGNFGSGGTCTFKGSLDGVNWHTLNDPHERPLAFTAAKIEAILELSIWLRPVVTGDANTNLKVTFAGRAR